MIDEILKIHDDPELAYKPKIQLSRMLKFLDIELQKFLSIRFAEHVAWIFGNHFTGNNLLKLAIELLDS